MAARVAEIDIFPSVDPSSSTDVSTCYSDILERHFKDVFKVMRVEATVSWEKLKMWNVYFTTKDTLHKFTPNFDSPAKVFDFCFELEDSIILNNGYHITYHIVQGLNDPLWLCTFAVKQSRVSALEEQKPKGFLVKKKKHNSKNRNNNNSNTVVTDFIKHFSALCCVMSSDRVADSQQTRKESNSTGFSPHPKVQFSDEKKRRFHNSFFARMRIKKKIEKHNSLKPSKEVEINSYNSVPPPNFRVKYLLRYFDQCNFRQIFAIKVLSGNKNFTRQEYFWAKNVVMQLGVNISAEEARDLYPELLDKFGVRDADMELIKPDFRTVGVEIKDPCKQFN